MPGLVPPRPIDLTKLTAKELRILLDNNQRAGQQERCVPILRELSCRGLAKGNDFALLNWNQHRVREVMRTFKKAAEEVAGNLRTSYTEAGGLKIGRSKNDPDRMWIDTYCAIKTPRTNAVFVCYIKAPGKEPVFQLHINGELIHSYNADQLEEAMSQWRTIASSAA